MVLVVASLDDLERLVLENCVGRVGDVAAAGCARGRAGGLKWCCAGGCGDGLMGRVARAPGTVTGRGYVTAEGPRLGTAGGTDEGV